MTDLDNKLPEICASFHPTTGKPILIKRGERGYWPTWDAFDVDGFNEHRGVTAAQREAMEIGSMCWDVPGADPDKHR
jgi:hypothetical protein